MSIYRNVPVSVNIIGLLIVVDLPKMNLEHFCHPLFFLIRKSVKHSLVTASEMFPGALDCCSEKATNFRMSS